MMAVLLGLAPASASAAEYSATASNFSSVYASAQAGDTIRLASGNYGTFRASVKPGIVTIAAQPGATPRIGVHFNPAANITLDGVKITDGYISDYRTKNITIRNSNFDGAGLVLRGGATDLVNANILLDNNVHSNRNVCSGCYDGRIQIAERTDQPTGITIQNSVFHGGSADGILNGGNGVRILNNEFRDIHQTDPSAHTDSIQLYGSKNTVIRGNYFHNVAVGIMCADGCDHETIEDNVFAINGSPYAMTFLSDNGSTIRHNTFLDYGICDYGQRCGTLYLGNKSSDPVSRGTIVKDNILTRICVCDGTVSGIAEDSHNLFTMSSTGGAQAQSGTPTYVGGANPSSLAGFALAAGSLGKGNASDGTDRGARIGAAPPPPPPPPPPLPPPPLPSLPSLPSVNLGALVAALPSPPTSAPAAEAPADTRVDAPSFRLLAGLRSIGRRGRIVLRARSHEPSILLVDVKIRPGSPVRSMRGARGTGKRGLIKIEPLLVAYERAGKQTITLRLSRDHRLALKRSRDARVSIVVHVVDAASNHTVRRSKRTLMR